MPRRLIRLMWRPRLWRFAAVGFSGVFVNLGFLFLFSDVLHIDDRLEQWLGHQLIVFGVRDVVSSAAAIELSILWNFLLNNAWTFRDKNARARSGVLSRLVAYNVVSLVGLLIQLAAFIGLNALIMRSLGLNDPGLYKYGAQLVGIGAAMAWNFLSNFYFTWAQHDDEPEDAPERPAGLERTLR